MKRQYKSPKQGSQAIASLVLGPHKLAIVELFARPIVVVVVVVLPLLSPLTREQRKPLDEPTVMNLFVTVRVVAPPCLTYFVASHWHPMANLVYCSALSSV